MKEFSLQDLPGYTSRTSSESPQRISQDKETDSAAYTARNVFVGKVLSITTCSLLVSTAIVASATMSLLMQEILMDNVWIAWTSLAASVAITMFLDLFPFLRRRTPVNIFLLAILALAQGLFLATFTVYEQTISILLALTVTCAAAGTSSILGLYAIWDMSRFRNLFSISFYVLICIQIGVTFYCSKICPTISMRERLTGTALAILFAIYNGCIVKETIATRDFVNREYEDELGVALTLHFDILNVIINVLRVIVNRHRQKRSSEASPTST